MGTQAEHTGGEASRAQLFPKTPEEMKACAVSDALFLMEVWMDYTDSVEGP